VGEHPPEHGHVRGCGLALAHYVEGPDVCANRWHRCGANHIVPEQVGGSRNWDYRFCWLRDATLTLLAFMNAGYYDEARYWRD
jgi:hypothetical protein